MREIEKEEDWVMSRRNKHHGLEPLRKACAAVGNPQNHLKIIHIAGTNGKGSVSKAVNDILIAHGFNTGLFTSPHLTDHRDRMRIDNQWISEEDFHYYLNKSMPLILQYDLGMFEIDCLIAFQWFYEKKTDFAIIECGLGGRLDNTNIIDNSVLSIITTVARDHTEVLGSRIEQIAFEKAGIFRPCLPAVAGRLSFSARQVVRRHAVRLHTPLHFSRKYRSLDERHFIYRNDIYEMATDGQYQKMNLSLALEAAMMLGIDIHDKKTHEAVRRSIWPGRFERVMNDPSVILDGAHNEEGAAALCRSISTMKKPVTVVFSALKDKPGRRMAAMYQKVSDTLVITEFKNMRADTAADLYVPGAFVEKDWKKAVREAVNNNKEGTIVITGSLYFISLARPLFSKGEISL